MRRSYRLVLGLLGLFFNGLVTGSGAFKMIWDAKGGDFLPFYIACRLSPTNEQYNRQKVLEMQRSLISEEKPALMSVRLPFYYRILSPLGNLPYRSALEIWLLLIAAATIGAIALYPAQDRFNLIVASMASLPLFWALLECQDVTIVWLTLACGLFLRARGSPLWAGVVLAMLAIKFNLFALIPLVFLLRREWSTLIGMAGGGAALMVFNFVCGGWTWPRRYWRVISNPDASPGARGMPNLHGLDEFIGARGALEAVLVVLVLLLAARIVARNNFETAIAAALIGSLLISHHSYVQDAAMLLPALVTISRTGNPVASIAAWISLTPAPYFLAMQVGLGIVPALLLLVTLISIAMKPTRPVALTQHVAEGKELV